MDGLMDAVGPLLIACTLLGAGMVLGAVAVALAYEDGRQATMRSGEYGAEVEGTELERERRDGA